MSNFSSKGQNNKIYLPTPSWNLNWASCQHNNKFHGHWVLWRMVTIFLSVNQNFQENISKIFQFFGLHSTYLLHCYCYQLLLPTSLESQIFWGYSSSIEYSHLQWWLPFLRKVKIFPRKMGNRGRFQKWSMGDEMQGIKRWRSTFFNKKYLEFFFVSYIIFIYQPGPCINCVIFWYLSHILATQA